MVFRRFFGVCWKNLERFLGGFWWFLEGFWCFLAGFLCFLGLLGCLFWVVLRTVVSGVFSVLVEVEGCGLFREVCLNLSLLFAVGVCFCYVVHFLLKSFCVCV